MKATPISLLVEIIENDMNDVHVRHRFNFGDIEKGRQFAELAQEAYNIQRVRTYVEYDS